MNIYYHGTTEIAYTWEEQPWKTFLDENGFCASPILRVGETYSANINVHLHKEQPVTLVQISNDYTVTFACRTEVEAFDVAARWSPIITADRITVISEMLLEHFERTDPPN